MAELPILFRQQMLALLPDEADALLQALRTEPSVAVRVNRRKATPPPTDDHVAWCRSGIYLDARRQFTFDPLLHSGCYYVQDASSMFISHVLSQVAGNSPVAYLDLCAAPGGKTTAAIDALPDGSLVVANEIDSRRVQILRENVVKWGYPHCVVTNSDASRLGKLHEAFDIVAADMPCSGEGMMRKDDEAVAQWTPALVEQCAARQREIASDIWQALKPGGIFIYSTCTFNRAENEDMIDFLVRSLGAEPVDIVSDPSWGIHKGVDTPYPCFRFMPHLTRGEGLFMAVVRKNGEYAEKETKKDKNKSKKRRQRASRALNALNGSTVRTTFPSRHTTMRFAPSPKLISRLWKGLQKRQKRCWRAYLWLRQKAATSCRSTRCRKAWLSARMPSRAPTSTMLLP